MPGLIEEGFRLRGDAIQGHGETGALKLQRDQQNYQLSADHQARQGQMIGTILGAVAGALNMPKTGEQAQGIGKEQTTVGGRGGAAVFPAGAIQGAAVTQGALPQSPGYGTANTGAFPQGAVSGAPMAQGSLPQSPTPATATPSGNWWDVKWDW